MSIEINGQTNSPRLNAREGSVTQRTGDETNPKSQTSAQTTGSDTVSLTDAAAMMQRIQASISQLPVVDSSRVDAIKMALNDGTYQINSDMVADKLMSFEAELGASL